MLCIEKISLICRCILLAGILGLGLTGCESMGNPRPRVTNAPPESVSALQQLPPDARPRIAVLEFVNKANNSSGRTTGTGMADQMVTALAQTRAFTIIERAHLDAIDAEQVLVNTSRFDPRTAAAIGHLEGVDFFVVGAITEYEEGNASVGGTAPVVGGGLGVIVDPLLHVAVDQTHIGIDMRLIDVRTGRIVSATSVEGRPRDLGFGVDSWLGAFGGSTRYPIEKAIRACIAKGVKEIADSVKAEWIDNQGRLHASERHAQPAEPDQDAVKKEVKEITYVRPKPSRSSEVIEKVPEGNSVTVLDEKGDWAKVRTAKGTVGWTLTSNFKD